MLVLYSNTREHLVWEKKRDAEFRGLYFGRLRDLQKYTRTEITVLSIPILSKISAPSALSAKNPILATEVGRENEGDSHEDRDGKIYVIYQNDEDVPMPIPTAVLDGKHDFLAFVQAADANSIIKLEMTPIFDGSDPVFADVRDEFTERFDDFTDKASPLRDLAQDNRINFQIAVSEDEDLGEDTVESLTLFGAVHDIRNFAQELSRSMDHPMNKMSDAIIRILTGSI